jgi:hypothetical protein
MQEFEETEKTLKFPPDRCGQREEAIRKFLTHLTQPIERD